MGQAADLVLTQARTLPELICRPQSERAVAVAGRTIDTTLPDYRELAALPQGYITFGSKRKGYGRVWHKAAQANVAGVSAASET